MRDVAKSRLARLIAVGAVLAVGVTVGIRMVSNESDAGAGSAPDALLQFIDPADLTGDAWRLSEAPADYTPRVSKQVAEDAAKAFMPGVIVRETVLLEISWPSLRTPVADLNGVVWVVNLEPGTYGLEGPSQPCFTSSGEPYRPERALFMLTFVSPETGDVLSHIQQPAPPEGGLTCGDAPTPQTVAQQEHD